MNSLNQKQTQAYEDRIYVLWKANKTLVDTLKGVQGSLSLDDPQQSAIFNRIQVAMDELGITAHQHAPG
jgi:uncharacterized protein (DUF779 family)